MTDTTSELSEAFNGRRNRGAPAVERTPDGQVLVPVTHPDRDVRLAKDIDDLIQAGYNEADVCEILTIQPQDIERVMDRALRTLARENPGERNQMRSLANRRLNRLLRAVWTKAIDPNHPEQIAANARAQAIVDRQIKLMGLDAPTEITVQHRATEQEIAAWVAHAHATKDDLPDEADIFDVEVVEDQDES